MHKSPLIFFIIFAFLSASIAQTTSAPAQTTTGGYQQSQATSAQAAPTYTSGSPVIQYGDDKLAVVAWKSATSGEGRVYYGTDPANLNLVAEDTANSTSHRVHLSNLTASTTYYFEIEAESGQPQVFTFRTPAAGATPLRELRASVATNVPSRNSGIQITSGPTIQFADDRSAVITWNTAVAAPSALYYGTVTSNLSQSAFGEPNATNHRVYLNNLVPSSTYYIQVDTGSPSSPIRTFQTVATGAAPIYNQVAAMMPRSTQSTANAAPTMNSSTSTTNAVSTNSTSPNTSTASTSTNPSSDAPQLGRREDLTVYPGGAIIPAGTEIQAKIEQALSSKTSRQGDQFTALILEPINGTNGRVAIPAGTRIRGEVSGVEQGKVLASVRGKARLNLKFNDIAMPNGSYTPLEATLVSVGKAGASANEEGQVQDKTQGKEVAKDVGIGAGLGTVAGLIFGSALKGLAIGAVAGGGYVLATQGRDVNIPQDANIVLKTDRAISLPPNATTGSSPTNPPSSSSNPQ